MILDKEIFLGNRDNKSCSIEWLESVEQEFLQQNVSVQKNNPYKGGYITHHYGLANNVYALQIEMNQCLYIPQETVVLEDCEEIVQSPEFQATKSKLKNIFKVLITQISE